MGPLTALHRLRMEQGCRNQKERRQTGSSALLHIEGHRIRSRGGPGRARYRNDVSSRCCGRDDCQADSCTVIATTGRYAATQANEQQHQANRCPPAAAKGHAQQHQRRQGCAARNVPRLVVTVQRHRGAPTLGVGGDGQLCSTRCAAGNVHMACRAKAQRGRVHCAAGLGCDVM